ncbi:hypothetical protein V3C97_07795 (plasmid) [Ligilactobacillus saerimneri]|uniref:hypothetical protein n=1 Tax=Ligilactobacillus saerimneri TaxID=228229 RepID=UPI0030D0D650
MQKEKQEAVTNSRSITTKAQTLISDNEKKRNDLDYQLEQVQQKEIEIESRIQKEAARKAEKIAADKKRHLQQQYSDHKRGLRQKEDELEAQFRKLVTWFITGAAVLGLVVGFVAHTGRVKIQAYHIDRLAKKLDQTKNTVEKQEKKIDKLQYMDEATLERKIDAIDQISYIVNDPVVGESARTAVKHFVNKKELRELKRELDRSRKAGKVGWLEYADLDGKLRTSANAIN